LLKLTFWQQFATIIHGQSPPLRYCPFYFSWQSFLKLVFRSLSFETSSWRGKGADEIEGELQKVVSQLGNRVMGRHGMAARITELKQEGSEWDGAYQLTR
jgi:hypothetical protein